MNRLRGARLQAHMTQVQAAKAVGMNQISISRYETGVRKLDVETAKKLAKVYGVHWTIFYEDTDDGQDLDGEGHRRAV